MRTVFSALAGGIFGVGLLLSGMTDTQKVQGWLDFFGDWDPTLAFVMGGAIIPMAIAWRVTQGRTPRLGGTFPKPSDPEITGKLTVGSLMFGAGWGLTGLCPGPAIASIMFGGWGGILFLTSMLIGMGLAPRLSSRLDASPSRG